MTHAVIFEKSGSHEIVGFQTEGHAGYADAGSDIVCKGKGIRYADEYVRRKEGKTGAKKK